MILRFVIQFRELPFLPYCHCGHGLSPLLNPEHQYLSSFRDILSSREHPANWLLPVVSEVKYIHGFLIFSGKEFGRLGPFWNWIAYALLLSLRIGCTS